MDNGSERCDILSSTGGVVVVVVVVVVVPDGTSILVLQWYE